MVHLEFRNEADTNLILDLLKKQGKWTQMGNGRWTSNTRGLIEVQDEGLFEKTNVYKCNCCKEHFLIHKRNRWVPPNQNLCDVTCAWEAGWRKNEQGQWIEGQKELGQIGKFDYRVSTKVAKATEKHPWRIGFEIEKEDEDILRQVMRSPGIQLPKGWILVHDGSLNDYGFEFVSPGYNLNDNIMKDFKAMKDLFDAGFSKRCGGHISISKLGMEGEDLAGQMKPMVSFFLSLFPQRLLIDQIGVKTLRQCIQDYKAGRRHYCPVWFGKGGRMELRMIGAVQKYRSLVRRFEVIQYFIENQPSLNRTIKSMETGFLKDKYEKVYTEEQWEEKLELVPLMAEWFYSQRGARQKEVMKYVEK